MPLVAVRRLMFVITWVVLSVQLFGLTLGTVRVCVDGEHTHGGVPAPDCAMHHQAPRPGVADGHAHHGYRANSSDTNGARIACRCSEQAPSTYLGELAVIEKHVVAGPYLQAAIVSIPAGSAVTRRVSPPSPPPR